MEKDQLVEVEVSPSEEVIPASTTTAETKTTAPAVNEQHAETIETVEVEGEAGETPLKEEEEPKPENDELNKQRINLKMSKLEKERNEASKRAEEQSKETESIKRSRYQDTLELLNDPTTLEKAKSKLVSNPQAYEDFRRIHKETTGEELGSYAERFGQAPQTDNRPQGYTNQPYLDPTTLKNQLKTELREEQAVELAAQAFWKDVPEMDPKNAKSEEDLEILGIKAGVIENNAAYIRRLNPNLSLHEAYIEAYNMLPENRNRQAVITRESGELAGKAKAFSSASSTSIVASGSATSPIKSATTYKLSNAEKEHYDELRKTDPKGAEKYAKYAHNQRVSG